MAQTVVSAKKLVKRYKALIALDHFSLEIKEGEILGLLAQTVRERLRRSTASYPCWNMTRVKSRYLARQ